MSGSSNVENTVLGNPIIVYDEGNTSRTLQPIFTALSIVYAGPWVPNRAGEARAGWSRAGVFWCIYDNELLPKLEAAADNLPTFQEIKNRLATSLQKRRTTQSETLQKREAYQMSKHAAGKNPIQDGEPFFASWYEYVEDSLDSLLTAKSKAQMSYSGSYALAPNTGSNAVLQFSTVVFDTSSELTTGADAHFTAATAGYFNISALVTIWAASPPLAGSFNVVIRKTSGVTSTYPAVVYDYFDTTAAGAYPDHTVTLSTLVQLAAGDSLRVCLENASAGNYLVTVARCSIHQV
jgi:hypothetical protein